MRLSQFIQQAGLASRRKADELIENGHVRVNDQIVIHPYTRVSPQDKVYCLGELVKKKSFVYYLLNKPKGFVCTSQDPQCRRKVVDLFPPHLNLFTVGRLDKETTGLLILTNDGSFAQRVIHPSFGHTKEYLVKIYEYPTSEALKSLEKGMVIEGSYVKPKKVERVRKNTLKITVSEGKKREIRLLIEKAGLSLMSLKRIRLGPLVLGGLAEGQYRLLTEKERAFFEPALQTEA